MTSTNTLTTAAAAAALPAKIDPAWLAEQSPWDVQDALVAELKQRFGLSMSLRHGMEITGQKLDAPKLIARHSSPTSSKPDWAGALALVESACAPAPDGKLAQAIAVLGELTRGNTQEADLQVRAYVAKLREYPADVAMDALNTWPERSKWFPAWLELKERMTFVAERRANMLAALRHELGVAKPKRSR